MMNFKAIDFLTKKEFETVIDSIFVNDKSDVIASKLKNYCFFNSTDLYTIQDNITYIKNCSKSSPMLLTSIISRFLEGSFKNLTEDERKLIKLEYPKTFAKVFTNSNIETYRSQLQVLLTIDKSIIFDTTPNEMHFKNGYYDFKDQKFKQRIIAKHYITKYIERDYKQSTNKEQEEVLKYIKQIYSSNIEDMKCVLYILGSSLSGKSIKNQEALFLLGLGSSGKSIIMNLTKLSITVYLKELKSDTFCQQNSKIDKILSSYAQDPQIRISWINEMKDSMNDGSLFKGFIDGEIQTTQLYTDGQISINHMSKVIGTANEIPNFKIDTGISRRFIGLTHQSDFTDIESKVNHKKNIYLKDIDLLEKLSMGNLLNAWFDILAVNCHEFLNGKKIKYTENFKQTKDVVISSNDKIGDFVDGSLIITNDEKDRISKDEMLMYYKEQYPDDYKNSRQLISQLQDKSIKYSCQLRINNIKGCFYGVKPRTNNDKHNEDMSKVKTIDELEELGELNDKIVDELEVEELKLYKSENKNLKKQIEALKQELELLKNQIKPEPIKEEVKVVKETKTKTKVKEVKPIKQTKKEVEITREEIDNMVDNFF